MRNANDPLLPPGSPPRWPAELPGGPDLWQPERTLWTPDNTDGLDTCDLIEACLRLTKGALRGELVRLRHWQADLICDILRLDANGQRLYLTYLLFIARKNSKSLIGAGLALDGLFDEPGAEVYSCAGDKDQGKLVFKEVKEAVEMSPDLSEALKVYKDAIEYPAQGSVYRVLSSEAFTKEGLNPSRVIFDEFHVQPDDDLWNVMNQGSDTRAQPLIIALTTKGVMSYTDGTDTVCLRNYRYAKQVQSGEIDDPNFGARIYETDPKVADYRDPAAWRAGNPALGDFLLEDKMAAACRKMPEADFKAKRLNIWMASGKTWMPDGAWSRLAAPRDAIPGEKAILAFDGSFDNDATALVAWLLGGDMPYLTLLGLWERPFDAGDDWIVPVAEVEALITAVYRSQPPADIDDWPAYGRTIRPIYGLDVDQIVFDPARWNRTFMVLDEEGLPCVEFPNSAERMVPATQKFFEGAVDRQAFRHDGHPALARHVANAVTKLSTRGTMVSKAAARAKIDALVAAICGYDQAVPNEVEEHTGWMVVLS